MKELEQLLERREEWLMERILLYAEQQGYTEYTSTLLEAWRLSISGLTTALVKALERSSGPPEFSPHSPSAEDPVTAFGLAEAERHRGRGVSLGMFLGLFKYYRQAYLDLIGEFVDEAADGQRYSHFILRCFDCIELVLCTQWNDLPADEAILELQEANRELTNEKNRYLTLFESMSEPAFLLDGALRLTHYNIQAGKLLGMHADPGEVYYGLSHGGEPPKAEGEATVLGSPLAELLPWLETPLEDHERWELDTHRTEVQTESFGTSRWYGVSVTRMRDVSGKFSGAVVVVTDITMHKSIQELHAINEERLSLALEATSDGVWDWNVQTGDAFFSPRYYTMLGYVPYEFEPSYEAWRELLHPADLERAEAAVQKHLEEGLAFRIEFRMRTKNGQWRWMIGRGKVATFNEAGEPVRMVGTHMDITERRQAEAALARREAQLRGIFDTVGSGIALMDSGGNIRRANAKLAEMLAYDAAEDLVGVNLFEVLRPDYEEDIRSVFAGFDMGSGLTNRQTRIMVSRAGRELWTDQTLSVVLPEPDMPRSIVFSATDITEHKRMEEEIRTLASTDPLTGVNNRRNFLHLSEFELAKSLRHGRPLAALMIDIDHFKRINDTYGHHVGDVTLKKCTEVCVQTLRKIDVFGRLGGEEFGAVLGETGERRAMKVAERLRQVLSETEVVVDRLTIRFEVSIGVAVLDGEDGSIEGLLQRADEALYEAKRTGRNKVVSARSLPAGQSGQSGQSENKA